MGATIYYDEMLPPQPEYQRQPSASEGYQVEVLTHGGQIFLRMGAKGERDEGGDTRTVLLSPKEIQKLVDGLRDAAAYHNHQIR